MTTTPWRIEYNNDVGPNDDGFWEWWEVTNDERTFKCSSNEDAEWLIAILTKNERYDHHVE